MNRYERVAEYLDTVSIEMLGFCQAKGACACRGYAGCHAVNGGPVREHELIKYVQGKLIPNQFPRRDIHDRIQRQLSKHGDPADFIGQHEYMKDGKVWANYVHRHTQLSVDIQVTGILPGENKIHIITHETGDKV